MDSQLYHRPLTTARLSGGVVGLLACLLSTGCVLGPPVYASPGLRSVPLGEPAAPAAAAEAAEVAGKPALAVLTLVDARPEFHRDALPSHRAEGGGWTGEAPTREGAWKGPLAELATEDLIRRLRATGRFSRVERVEVVGAVAPDALLLRGRLRRLRGFQGYHVKRGTPPELIESLGEAYLDELELGNPRTHQLHFLGQAGARIDVASELDPFALARQAWEETARGLVERIAAADLERPLERSVHLPPEARGEVIALVGSLPGHWQLDESAPVSQPPGWVGAEDCGSLALFDPSRTYYQPQLGHYQARLRLWICAPQVHLELRLAKEGPRFTAELLGSLAGAPVLLFTLGKSSWPEASAEILRFLGADPLAGPILRWPRAEPEAVPDSPGRPGPGEKPASPARVPVSPGGDAAATDP